MLQCGSERPSFGGFRLWAIVNNVAVNTGVQVALKALLPILLGIHPEVKLWNHMVILGKGNGNPLQHSCWKIPWMEEPDRLQSMGSQRVGHD